MRKPACQLRWAVASRSASIHSEGHACHRIARLFLRSISQCPAHVDGASSFSTAALNREACTVLGVHVAKSKSTIMKMSSQAGLISGVHNVFQVSSQVRSHERSLPFVARPSKCHTDITSSISSTSLASSHYYLAVLLSPSIRPPCPAATIAHSATLAPVPLPSSLVPSKPLLPRILNVAKRPLHTGSASVTFVVFPFGATMTSALASL